MERVDTSSSRPRAESRDGWIELFPFVFFAVTLVASVVAIIFT